MLDKTGTITLGNRRADEFISVDGAKIEELADAAQLASLADETPEGRSIVVLAKQRFGLRGRELSEADATFVPFSAKTRMVYGVVGIVMGNEAIDASGSGITLSILGETALALEKEYALAQREEAAVLAKNEQLRANLLRSVSHAGNPPAA